ncbi:TadE/TadG family type IV pilus assembly protein [Allosphingosinicella flava]|uniref:TadE/TadG family type IV pilus assembly protein n=1 Tax=Allosphingosinicella flava TaxID=2771430 RepID=UPI001A9C2890|nr:hypothetical protein [Sphingosinicella flava]
MRGLLHRLRTNERGASVIEFAFAAPVLAMVLVNAIDLAEGLARKFELEQASYRALEKITAGTVGATMDSIRREAAAVAGEDETNVTIRSWLECNRVEQPSINGACTGTEETARFVSVTIRGYYKPKFTASIVSRAVGASPNGSFPLRATATMRVQ